jgi:hypothetical protein
MPRMRHGHLDHVSNAEQFGQTTMRLRQLQPPDIARRVRHVSFVLQLGQERMDLNNTFFGFTLDLTYGSTTTLPTISPAFNSSRVRLTADSGRF